MITLLRCRFCNIFVEGIPEDSCPKCNQRMKVMATYPDTNEETNINDEGQVLTEEVR